MIIDAFTNPYPDEHCQIKVLHYVTLDFPGYVKVLEINAFETSSP